MFRNAVPSWVTDNEGKKWQQHSWETIAGVLESIEPGCVGRALNCQFAYKVAVLEIGVSLSVNCLCGTDARGPSQHYRELR